MFRSPFFDAATSKKRKAFQVQRFHRFEVCHANQDPSPKFEKDGVQKKFTGSKPIDNSGRTEQTKALLEKLFGLTWEPVTRRHNAGLGPGLTSNGHHV